MWWLDQRRRRCWMADRRHDRFDSIRSLRFFLLVTSFPIWWDHEWRDTSNSATSATYLDIFASQRPFLPPLSPPPCLNLLSLQVKLSITKQLTSKSLTSLNRWLDSFGCILSCDVVNWKTKRTLTSPVKATPSVHRYQFNTNRLKLIPIESISVTNRNGDNLALHWLTWWFTDTSVSSHWLLLDSGMRHDDRWQV